MNKVRVPAAGHTQIKQLSLCVVLAMHGLAMAQARQEAPAESLPGVKVRAQAERETTEGSGAYATKGKGKTATPLGLSQRDTPQSMTVITRQRMEDQGMLNITDVLNNTTGVFVHQYETSRAQFTARGFDINALMIDGVPTTWSQPWSSGEVLSSLAMYDHVEVVRGATGLTTGAGDPGAAVNMVRKRATSRELTGSAELSLGSWNQRRALVDLSTPLNKARTVRARVVGEYGDRDSYIDGFSNKNHTLYATVEADLTSSTLLTAGLSQQENNARGSMWGGLPVWYSDGTRTNWDRSKTTSADWVRWDTTHETAFASLEHRFDNGWNAKASYNHGDREADSRLLYLGGQSADRITGLGLSAGAGSYLVNTTQNDVALQASGPFGLLGRQHELSFGYVYSKQDFTADTRGYISGAAPSINTWDRSYPEPTWNALTRYDEYRITQQSAYSAARLRLTDPLRLIVGARVTNYEKAGPTSSLKASGELTPYAGLTYDLNPSVTLYGSYTDIFQPQQERDSTGRTLDPIVGKSMELGAKGEFLDGRLNASAAIFQIRQDNLAQATGQTIPGSVSNEAAYRAARGATSRGFELELAGALSQRWNLSAGYSQFKAADADGADVNTVYPRKTLRLFSTYRLPALNALTLGGGVNWQSESHALLTNPQGATEKVAQKSHALVSLMGRYEFTPRLSARLNIDNVFDKTYFTVFSTYGQMTYGSPRNATLNLNYKF